MEFSRMHTEASIEYSLFLSASLKFKLKAAEKMLEDTLYPFENQAGVEHRARKGMPP